MFPVLLFLPLAHPEGPAFASSHNYACMKPSAILTLPLVRPWLSPPHSSLPSYDALAFSHPRWLSCQIGTDRYHVPFSPNTLREASKSSAVLAFHKLPSFTSACYALKASPVQACISLSLSCLRHMSHRHLIILQGLDMHFIVMQDTLSDESTV